MDLFDDNTPPDDDKDPDYNPNLKRKRPRRFRITSTPYSRDNGNPLTLSREQLLTITSKEFKNLVAQFDYLTQDQILEVRRQRRLIKNRESAAISRKRKSVTLERLQEENNALKKEVEQLKTQLQGCYCSLEMWPSDYI